MRDEQNVHARRVTATPPGKGRLSGALKRKRRLVHGAACHLLVNPAVRLLEAVLERDRRLPPELFPDQRVVAVPPAHPLRRREDVLTLELDPCDALDDVDEAVDGHELRRPEIDRLRELALQEPEEALDRVVDVREAARL